jgi:formylglycine-generating enzyme required for sulfatase activity
MSSPRHNYFVVFMQNCSICSIVAVSPNGENPMPRERHILNITVALAIGAGGLACRVTELTAEKKPYPLWDGKESVADYAKRVNLDPAIALDLGDGVKMDFVLIPAGKFMMGSPSDDKDRFDAEEPQHDVTIGKPFYMGKYEVMQEQYEKITKSSHSGFKGARNPVEFVTFGDAQAFCKQMSQKNGRFVRLPSEAEWEYACRAGSMTPYHPPREREKGPPLTDEQRRRAAELISRLSSKEYADREKATRDLIALGSGVLPLLDETKAADPEGRLRMTTVKAAIQPQAGLAGVAWFADNSADKTHPVGEKEPNAFNLHDMHGNVWEWVEDDWHDNYTGAPTNETAWIETPRGDRRVLRGGSWSYIPRVCRSACRHGHAPKDRYANDGFRVVLSSSPRTP